jgi:hypothetical protein
MDEAAVQAADIFERAAVYIRRYGWQVTGMSRHGKSRCSMGALASAHPDEVWDESLAQLMYQELYDELNGIGLTEFNYAHNDGERVAQLFERVAVKLRHACRLVNV